MHHDCHLCVGFGVVEFPIGADQFVTELRTTRLQGELRHVIGFDRVRTNNEQRIGLLFFEQFGLRRRQILTHRAQRRRKRVSGPHRALKILLREDDPFRLEHHTVLAALQIDRSTVRAERTFVGNDRVLSRLASCIALGIGDRQFGGPQFSSQSVQFAGRGLFLIAFFGLQFFELGNGPAQAVGAIAQTAEVILQMTEFRSRVVQIGLSFVARLLELRDSPLECVAIVLVGFAFFAFGDQRLLPLARKADQQRYQRAGRANQDRQQRNQPDASGG